MKIKEIKTVQLNIPSSGSNQTPARRPSWAADAEVANPMSKYPQYKRHRSTWLPSLWCSNHRRQGYASGQKKGSI